MTDPPWVVWSFEHEAWWAPGRRGYVEELARAGRYSEPEARAIEAQANLVRLNEWAMPLADAERLGHAR
jgi:hypothetical protein